MPESTDSLTLALVLTAAGATVGASLITGFIEILKKLGGVGVWVDAGREPTIAFVLSALLVAVAYWSTLAGKQPDAQGVFAAFLAWYGIAQISMGVKDTVTSFRSPGD